MSSNLLDARPLDHGAQDEAYDNGVVGEPDDWNEVRDQIDRQR